MGMLQRRVNLFHYNIWRFERWTRSLLFGDPRITTIRDRRDNELDDIVPFAVDSVDEWMLPNYSGKHFSVLVLLVLLSVLNLASAVFGFGLKDFWLWGVVACVIVSFVIDHILSPIPLEDPKENVLLNDFKNFETMSVSAKRRSGLITLLIVIGIWATSILSFIYYMRSVVKS
jgi:hypothetical protein